MALEDIYKTKGKKGRPAKSPATQFIADILEDGEWHEIEDLIQRLTETCYPVPRESIDGRRQGARIVVVNVARKNSYESKKRRVKSREYYTHLRKSPVVRQGAALRTCSTCGRAGLNVQNRIRRIVEFRVPKFSETSHGDQIAARLQTTYICIPCAQEELDAKGRQWRNPPPFSMVEGGDRG